MADIAAHLNEVSQFVYQCQLHFAKVSIQAAQKASDRSCDDLKTNS